MMRKIHLILGLFLAPWVLMYAASTMLMQHRELFTGDQNRIEPAYALVREEAFQGVLDKSGDSEAAAARILEDIGLEGSHRVRGSLEEGRLEIRRDRPIGSYRITWEEDAESVKIEKQRFGMAFFLEMLHRRRGFGQAFWANDVWAVIVDLFIVAVLAWAFTGVWMWWNMKSTRSLGALCMILGSALFALFVATI